MDKLQALANIATYIIGAICGIYAIMECVNNGFTNKAIWMLILASWLLR